jgi:hypothetical protein
MKGSFTTMLVGLICLVAGLCVGAEWAPQLKVTTAGQWIAAQASAIPWPTGTAPNSDDNQFESYEYPTIKWKPKPLSDAPGAIVRLWTTYDTKDPSSGTIKYKLTLFKGNKDVGREVQLIDAMGFKLIQFNASDFHGIPGAADIVEARDSVPCTEEQYRNARDYSVK